MEQLTRPFPGDPATLGAANVVSRLNGQFATMALGTNEGGAAAMPANAVLNLFDWEVTLECELTDVTAHGDLWKQPVPLKNSFHIRARAYFTAAQVTSYLSAWRLKSGGGTAANYFDPPLMQFTGYNTMSPGVAPANILFQGNAYITRGRIAVPMAMVEQEIELEGVGSPSVIG